MDKNSIFWPSIRLLVLKAQKRLFLPIFTWISHEISPAKSFLTTSHMSPGLQTYPNRSKLSNAPTLIAFGHPYADLFTILKTVPLVRQSPPVFANDILNQLIYKKKTKVGDTWAITIVFIAEHSNFAIFRNCKAVVIFLQFDRFSRNFMASKIVLLSPWKPVCVFLCVQLAHVGICKKSKELGRRKRPNFFLTSLQRAQQKWREVGINF